MVSTTTHNSSARALGLAAVVIGSLANSASAQSKHDQAASEALVFGAFPEANAYSCIVRDVDQLARIEIERRLPFKVHFNELGEHKLLVAFRGRRPVGLIYRRTEVADWGLTEIAWHLTLDMRVLSFEFTRGRNRYMSALERSAFARGLIGSNFSDVAAMLKVRSQRPKQERATKLAALTRVALRSAAKALTVTETVWRDQIQNLHDQAIGLDLFPAAATFTRRSTTFDLDDGDQQQSIEVKVIYAYDVGGRELGYVIWSHSQTKAGPIPLRWVVDRDLRVISTRPADDRPDRALLKACYGLDGQQLSAPDDADNPLSSLARGLATVVREMAKRREDR